MRALTDDQLQAVKKDLEQRLARFQRAFFERHGRNPNEEERAPANPAIARYREINKELAARAKAKQASELAAENENTGGAAGSKSHSNNKKSATFAVGEQMAQQAQVVSMARRTSEPLDSAELGEAAMAAPKSGLARFVAFVKRMTPSAAMTDLLVSWGQFTAIFGDMTLRLSERVEDGGHGQSLAPWATTLNRHVFRYFRIFNLDARSYQLTFDFAFLSSIGFREAHLAFTVIIPLCLSGVTILLLRSLGDIARLVLFTVSVLLIIFGAAAYAILGVAADVRGVATTEILDLNTTSLAYIVGIGAAGVAVSMVLFFYELHVTHVQVRDYLQREVDDLAERLYGVKETLLEGSVAKGHGKGGGGAGGAGSKKRLPRSGSKNGGSGGFGGGNSSGSSSGGGGGVQEALPNAAELNAMLEGVVEEEEEVGGRAKSAEEFLRQMRAKSQRRKHGTGPRSQNLAAFVKTLAMWLVLSLLALFFYLRAAELLPAAIMRSLPESLKGVYEGVAIVCTVASALLLLYELLTLSASGRLLLDQIVQILKAVYIGILVVVVSFLYIPISRQALQIFICQGQECGSGEWFPLQSPGSEASLWTYVTQFTSSYVDAVDAIRGTTASDASLNAALTLRPAGTCTSCDWLGECSRELAAELCPPSSSLRLAAAPQIDCGAQWAFYAPGAILTLAMFTMGVPYMFYQLTRRHVAMYESLPVYDANGDVGSDGKGSSTPGGPGAKTLAARRLAQRTGRGKYRAPPQFTPAELEDLWTRRTMGAERNRAKNLYCDFEYRWRYWKVALLAFKFLIVVVDVTTITASNALVPPSLMLTLHLLMTVSTTFAMPYRDRRPDMLAVAISVANVFNYCLLLAMALEIPAPSWILGLLIAVNFGVPLLALLLGWYLNTRDQRQEAEAEAAAEAEGRDTAKSRRKLLPPPEVARKRKGVERHMNEFTLRVLASWTWGVLLTSVVAGELIFIGTFAEVALTPVSGHTASIAWTADASRTDVAACYQEEFVRQQEFVGFHNWTAFTEACCCMSRSNVTDPSDLGDHITELWSCSNKAAASALEQAERPIVYKERHRRPLTPGSKVSAVRSFCAPYFNDEDGNIVEGMEPTWDEETGRLGVYWYNADGSVKEFFNDYW